jgi:hypothetical protein
MKFRQFIFSFFFLFSGLVSNAQGGTTIKATVDKNKILIGEPVQLTIEVYLSPESVKKSIAIDSIYHFEMLQKPVIDTMDTKGGLNLRYTYKITSFDSGHWVIPSIVISPAIKTDTIPVDVVFSEFDPNQDYHDIKDIIEIAPPKKKPWWWIIAGGILFLTAVAYYLLRKKKIVPVPVAAVVVDPYKEAILQLELLQKEKPLPKIFHTRLIDLFRLYVFRKKGISSLQKTTADLVLQLKNLNFTKEHFEKLFQALRLSDFVKFAKYIPTEADDMNSFNEIKSSIMTIEKSEANSSL